MPGNSSHHKIGRVLRSQRVSLQLLPKKGKKCEKKGGKGANKNYDNGTKHQFRKFLDEVSGAKIRGDEYLSNEEAGSEKGNLEANGTGNELYSTSNDLPRHRKKRKEKRSTAAGATQNEDAVTKHQILPDSKLLGTSDHKDENGDHKHGKQSSTVVSSTQNKEFGAKHEVLRKHKWSDTINHEDESFVEQQTNSGHEDENGDPPKRGKKHGKKSSTAVGSTQNEDYGVPDHEYSDTSDHQDENFIEQQTLYEKEDLGDFELPLDSSPRYDDQITDPIDSQVPSAMEDDDGEDFVNGGDMQPEQYSENSLFVSPTMVKAMSGYTKDICALNKRLDGLEKQIKEIKKSKKKRDVSPFIRLATSTIYEEEWDFSLLPVIPLKKKKHIRTMETDLDGRNYKRQFLEKLCSIGGSNIKENVINIFKKLFSTKLKTKMCWRGTKNGKIAFRDFTNIHDLIRLAVKSRFKKCTESRITKEVKLRFNQAKKDYNREIARGIQN